MLLTRDQFRERVLASLEGHCAVSSCSALAVDAHHIIERRLFPDGGYYVENGAPLCPRHHMLAEQTILSCSELREELKYSTIILPPHFYPDEQYDKWGNVILPSGRRLKGELFDDESVQRVLTPVLHLFDNRVKYPRTWHLPWSASVTSDDRVLTQATVDSWDASEIVVTEKMDGECTTLYRDYMHARSMDYNSHVSRNWMKNFHAQIAPDIPENMRICGENLWAKHSIFYPDLPSYFLGFSIWMGTRCLPWDETLEWFELFGIRPVKQWYRGEAETCPWKLLMLPTGNATLEHEGYVVRPADGFTLREFPTKVGKYVRAQHVQTHGHWMRSAMTPNKIIAND